LISLFVFLFTWAALWKLAVDGRALLLMHLELALLALVKMDHMRIAVRQQTLGAPFTTTDTTLLVTTEQCLRSGLLE
jgi:hypothetical protein